MQKPDIQLKQNKTKQKNPKAPKQLENFCLDKGLETLWEVVPENPFRKDSFNTKHVRCYNHRKS